MPSPSLQRRSPGRVRSVDELHVTLLRSRHARHQAVAAGSGRARRPRRDRTGGLRRSHAPRIGSTSSSTRRSPARRSTATSSASSPSISARASTRASGSVPTPRFPTPAASATTSSPRSRRSRCPTCAGRAAASPTTTTGARASARAGKRAVTLNPNWGGVTESNTFGTHEFMDFLGQIGSEAFLSVNVGSGTPQEAAEWLEYLTTAQPTTLGKERAANGHPAPYKVAFLGIGNESWDCGGNMTPEYYLSQLKVYSRFVRNFNPAQQNASQMLKIAVGPGGDEPRWTEWTETIMKAWKDHTLELGHRRPLAAQLHRHRLEHQAQVRRVRRGRVRQIPQGHARDGAAHRDALGHHGQVRSRRRRSRSSSMNGARGTRRCRAATRASWCSRTACATPSWRRST